MIRMFATAVLLSLGTFAAAQAIPSATSTNPRVQTVSAADGQVVQLTLLPDTAMTVTLDPAEIITQVTVGDRDALAARVSAERNTFQLLPQRTGNLGRIEVDTTARTYSFAARTGTGSQAAYLVEVRGDAVSPVGGTGTPVTASTEGRTWSYRLRGDREVRPARIFDDGARTSIEFAPDAALPAIFAIGPTGEEQLVNGYMRGNVYVIDRVWNELVFRIDREKASARRNDDPEQGDG